MALVHPQAGDISAIFFDMRELSIFVDESGHFDMTSKVSPYYLVSFVFHDQALDISDLVHTMDSSLIHVMNKRLLTDNGVETGVFG